MSVTARFAHRFRYLALLQASLAVGALYDGVYALLMFLAPKPTAGLLHLPLPGAPFYLWLLGIFLGMLAAFNAMAARHPRRYSGIIVVAIVGRLCGALAFTVAGLLDRTLLPGIALLAICDFILGAVPALLWLPVRK